MSIILYNRINFCFFYFFPFLSFPVEHVFLHSDTFFAQFAASSLHCLSSLSQSLADGQSFLFVGHTSMQACIASAKTAFNSALPSFGELLSDSFALEAPSLNPSRFFIRCFGIIFFLFSF
jgi:hypothetical protein